MNSSYGPNHVHDGGGIEFYQFTESFCVFQAMPGDYTRWKSALNMIQHVRCSKINWLNQVIKTPCL